MRSRKSASCGVPAAGNSRTPPFGPPPESDSARRFHSQTTTKVPSGRQQKDGDRDDPRDVIEAATNRRGKNRRSILGRKPLQYLCITLAGGKLRMQLADHYRRVRATDMVAFEQNLAATARAHQLMAETVEARLACAEHRDGNDAQQNALHHARPENWASPSPPGLHKPTHGAPSPALLPRPAPGPRRLPGPDPPAAGGSESAPDSAPAQSLCQAPQSPRRSRSTRSADSGRP